MENPIKLVVSRKYLMPLTVVCVCVRFLMFLSLLFYFSNNFALNNTFIRLSKYYFFVSIKIVIIFRINIICVCSPLFRCLSYLNCFFFRFVIFFFSVRLLLSFPFTLYLSLKGNSLEIFKWQFCRSHNLLADYDIFINVFDIEFSFTF